MASHEHYRPPVLEDWGNWDDHTSWEFWRSHELAPEQYNNATAAFLIAISDLATKSVVTQFNRARQRYEIPGGHVDPGEDAYIAAIREGREEGGIVAEISEIVPFGFRRINHLKPTPQSIANNYPPLAYNPFFYTFLHRPLEELTGDDVVEARIFSVDEMENLVRHRQMQMGEFAIIKAGLAAAYQDTLYGN